MNGTVQKAIRAELALLRMPLTVLDQQVLARLRASSKVRGVVGRGLEKLDGVASYVRPDASARGTATTRPAKTRPAATAESPAEELPVEEVEHLAEELLEEQEQHPLAGELADDDELRRVQAELKAKHRVEEEHQAGRA